MKKYKISSLIHQFYKELKIAKSKGKPVWKLIPHFFTYIRENRVKINRFDTGLPWLTKSAVQFLDNFVQEEMKVFEFGSGASTVYFSKKGVDLYSVEHDSKWFENVKQTIAKDNSNVDLALIEPEEIKLDQLEKSIRSSKDTRFLNHDALSD